MANLVSPGVSVTVTDESFFIPAAATTVPLLFIATADNKLRPDGVTPAAGTYESNVIRTVTSLTQSTQLYGIPRFLVDSAGNPQNGDCRNEYGLFALNQYLNVGNLAYVIRANVNLDDDITDIRKLWDTDMQEAAYVLENLVSSYLNEYNASNNLAPSSIDVIGTLGTITPGSGYTGTTYTNVPLTGGTGTGATADITVTATGIASLGFVTAGSGYTTGVHNNVSLTHITGLGTGAKANITVDITGAVTGVVLVNPGTGYTIGDSLTASGIGPGTLFSVPVAAIGVVTGVVLKGPGTGYTVSDALSATLPCSIASFGAYAGAGYIGPATPTVALTGGTGVGATATVAIDALGNVTGVTLVNPGKGYTAGDSLSATTVSLGGGSPSPVFSVIVATTDDFSIPVATVLTYKQTVNETEFLSLSAQATASVWASFSFQNSQADFTEDHTSVPLPTYSTGYNNPPDPTPFLGLTGIALQWVANTLGSVVSTEWTPTEASNTLLGAADQYKYTVEFMNETSLGANDAVRRVAIVTALQASINSNTDIRSETYEYNLILCPGFPEVDDEMLNLCVDIQEEAFVIGETPFDKSPDDVVVWAATVARQSSTDIAYYYPHGVASNLDGNNVFIAASGIALQTITYSDSVAQLWFAPAGTRRGLVTGVSDVGYVTGTLGTATTFNPVALNQGQRDNMYKYFTNLNPIVFFPGRGIIVWGQKTSAPDASALDRINVRRLIDYIKRQLRKNTMSFVFEPNDALTRANIKAVVDAFLGNLIIQRGLYDFATVCDETNNTPDRIDRNELYVDVALKPVKAAEFIYIPIRIVATGAQI